VEDEKQFPCSSRLVKHILSRGNRISDLKPEIWEYMKPLEPLKILRIRHALFGRYCNMKVDVMENFYKLLHPCMTVLVVSISKNG